MIALILIELIYFHLVTFKHLFRQVKMDARSEHSTRRAELLALVE
jgi:hypothetical protein